MDCEPVPANKALHRSHDCSAYQSLREESTMNTCSSNRPARHLNLVASVLMIVSTSAAFAAAPPAATNQAAPSKEVREKMASLHEQMAACLRSDKPISECRSQMMKSCQETMGDQGCPMMGHAPMGSGTGKRHHMTPHAAKSPEDHNT